MNLVNIKQKLLDNSKLCRELVYQMHKRSALKDPKAEASRVYRARFGKDIDWENPVDLIEKSYWLQYNTDTSLWTLCADKYAVRKYVEEHGLGCMLPTLYGKWDNADDVDFEKLPKSFVLKANNGSGTVLVVKDKSTLNLKKVRKMMKEWLKYTYGYNSADLFYTKIPPCLIAEEYHETAPVPYSCSLIDYKIWCFNGEPECIWVAFDRKNGQAVKMALFDLDWNPIPEHLLSTDHYVYDPNIKLEKPACLDEMLEACRKLTKPFKEVRADFYDINGKAYFGELTFSAGYGFYQDEYYKYLGSLIKL